MTRDEAIDLARECAARHETGKNPSKMTPSAWVLEAIQEAARRAAAPYSGRPQFMTDAEIAPMLGISVGFLQKDRITVQRIPFVRLGDRCLYDPVVVLATLRAQAVGGRRYSA